MTPTEQAMWHDIAEAIEPYCVNGAGYMKDSYEDPECLGFSITSDGDHLKITVYMHEPIWKYFPIEEDLRIFNKDKPGYFEGMPINGAEV